MPLLGASPATQFCTIPRSTAHRPTRGYARSGAEAEVPHLIRMSPIYFPGTHARFHGETLSGTDIIVSLFAIFGGLAFVLSAVGLYGVMSFSVSQRAREFGIRMAPRSGHTTIFRMVMTQGAWQLVIGLVLGTGAAALLLGVLVAAACETFSSKSDHSIHLFISRSPVC